MGKKKKELANFKSELHTISPLPLEMVAERLQDLQRKDRFFHIERLNEDEFGFVIRKHLRGRLSDATVLGTIWRWNGNFTRVDVDSQVDIVGQWLDVATQFVGLIISMILITPFFWFFSEVLPQAMYSVPLAIFLSLVALGLASMVILTIVRIFDIDLLKTRRYRALRDVDGMMQAVADKLSEYQPMDEPVLEFDGSETSLAALLQSEKYKHLRMSEDGEVDEDKA
jgi:hypothetical protein